MITILEGPDLAGKTTLAEQLGTKVLHSGQPTHDTWQDEYVRRLIADEDAWNHAMDGHLVLDRWHIGELVYPAIYRREAVLVPSMNTAMLIGEVLNALVPTNVRLLIPPADVLIARFKERGDDALSLEQILKARDGFIRVGLAHMPRTVVWS